MVKNSFNTSILSELTQKKAITYDKVGSSGVFFAEMYPNANYCANIYNKLPLFGGLQNKLQYKPNKGYSTDCYAHITYTL